MKLKAIYAGSFDPITYGHLHVISEIMELNFDRIVIAVGYNPAKKNSYMFDFEERKNIIGDVFKGTSHMDIVSFSNKYLIHLAMEMNCTHVVRGIRNASDFTEEMAMVQINKEIAASAVRGVIPKTIFIPTPSSLALVSSSMVKSLIGFNDWENQIKRYVPKQVWERLIAKHDAKNKLL